MPRLTRADLCAVLSDLVLAQERLLAHATALDIENQALRRTLAWHEQQQIRAYDNADSFTPIPPRKDA